MTWTKLSINYIEKLRLTTGGTTITIQAVFLNYVNYIPNNETINKPHRPFLAYHFIT